MAAEVALPLEGIVLYFSIVKQLLRPLLYVSAICGWITWVYSIIIDRESMYRKEQGAIVSTSACLEILTISNFQRRMRTWTMEMTFWLKGKSHTDIHSRSLMRPTRTMTFGFCVTIAIEKRTLGAWAAAESETNDSCWVVVFIKVEVLWGWTRAHGFQSVTAEGILRFVIRQSRVSPRRKIVWWQGGYVHPWNHWLTCKVSASECF